MRRIEAVVGPALVAYLNQVDGVVRTLAAQLKVRAEEIPSRVAGGPPPREPEWHTQHPQLFVVVLILVCAVE